MISSGFKEWLRLTTMITTDSRENHNLICPKCQKNMIDYQYVGDLRSREGFLDLWCNSCLHGIHLSRTKAPANVSMLSFDDVDEYKKKVPIFTQIEPY